MKIVSPSTIEPNANYAFKSMFYFEKEYSDANIKCDYDTNRNPFSIRKIIQILKLNPLKRQKFYPFEGLVLTTKKGFHLRVWYCHVDEYNVQLANCVKKIPANSILRMQELLNDDPERQRFNKIRVRKGEKCWNILWNCKFRNGKVISKEEAHEEYTRQLSYCIRDYGLSFLIEANKGKTYE